LPWLVPDAGIALGLLHDVRLSLWPMSRLFDAAEARRHWLYLPLATVLSNALLYATIGALAAWGRTVPAAFAAAHLGFDTDRAGAAVAAALAVIALVLHRLATRTGPPATPGR
jgi:hypothetical protein